MKKLLFALQDFIRVLEALRDDGGVKEIIIHEHDGYPTITDAADPTTILILRPADEANEDDEELH